MQVQLEQTHSLLATAKSELAIEKNNLDKIRCDCSKLWQDLEDERESVFILKTQLQETVVHPIPTLLFVGCKKLPDSDIFSPI